MVKHDGENAVRTYLLYLEDPANVIDQGTVADLQKKIQTAADPIEKLHLLTRLRTLSTDCEEELRQEFCAHAKEWANRHNVDASSFLELGVDVNVLRAAGFKVKTPTAPRTKARGQPASRTRRVRVDDVKAIMATRSGEFTLADLAESSGGSPMTVRRAVEQLVDAGDVKRLGPAPKWRQPGRAPTMYRRAASPR